MVYKVTDESIVKDFKFNTFTEMWLDFTNLFRPYKPNKNQFPINPKHDLMRDMFLPWHGVNNFFQGIIYLLTFLGNLALIATLIFPLWEILSAPKQQRLNILLSYPLITGASLVLGIKLILYGLSQLFAFATGLSVLKTLIRTFITWKIPSLIPLSQKTREIFKNISKDFRNTFNAYKSEKNFTDDLFQIFDGIYNFVLGTVLLTLFVVNLIFSCTLIIPMGMFFTAFADSKRETFKEKFMEALEAGIYFPYSALLTFSMGAVYLFRGVTEVLSFAALLTPLKICARQFVTWMKYGEKYQPIQANSDIQELVTKIKEKRGSFSDINEIIQSNEITDCVSKLSIKIAKYQEKGQLMDGASFNHPIMWVNVAKDKDQDKTYKTNWNPDISIQAFDECINYYSSFSK